MPQDHRTSKEAFPLAEAQRLRQQGQSFRAIAETIGWSMPQTRRYLLGEIHPNGNLPAIPTSQPIAVPSPHIAVASPSIAADMDELRARVDTLEAFMAAVQAEHRHASQPIAIPLQPIAAHRDESPTWVSRGLQVAADMLEFIDAYAVQHRLEKREVLDLALRTFFAAVAEEVRDA